MSQRVPTQEDGSPQDDVYPTTPIYNNNNNDDDDKSYHPHSHTSSSATIATATTTTTTTAGAAPTPTPSPPPPSTSSSSSIPNTLPSSSTSSASSAASSLSPQLLAQHQKSLREVVRNGDSSGLRRLLEAREGKLNLNVFDTEGQTVLHESCQLGNLELVKLLVNFGADVRLANRDGWSAVHIAAYGGHTDILLYLMTATSLGCGGNGGAGSNSSRRS